MKRSFGFACIAAAALAAVFASERSADAATLSIRVSAFNSGGGLIASFTDTEPFVPPATPHVFVADVGSFDIVISANTATSASDVTTHALLVNLTYNGATGAASEKLVVEFLGDTYVDPAGPDAFALINGSPSTTLLRADSVVFSSGIGVGGAALPGTIGDTSSFSTGLLTSSGSMGLAASVLVPNPEFTPVAFTIPNPFSYYQVLTFSSFQSNGTGNISAAAVVGPSLEEIGLVPEPASMAVWGGLSVLGLVFGRRFSKKSA